MNNFFNPEEFLTPEENIKKEVLAALKDCGKPTDAIERIIDAMDRKGFWSAPCSGGYHLCVEGGLAKHSLNVYKHAHAIAKALLSEKEYEEMKNSITVVSLLHDLGKTGDFGMPLYTPNILKSGKQSTAKPFTRNESLLPISHATTSIILLREAGFPLTQDEMFAIRYHDGLYERENSSLQGHETPLYLILHDADMWASRVSEISLEENTAED